MPPLRPPEERKQRQNHDHDDGDKEAATFQRSQRCERGGRNGLPAGSPIAIGRVYSGWCMVAIRWARQWRLFVPGEPPVPLSLRGRTLGWYAERVGGCRVDSGQSIHPVPDVFLQDVHAEGAVGPGTCLCPREHLVHAPCVGNLVLDCDRRDVLHRDSRGNVLRPYPKAHPVAGEVLLALIPKNDLTNVHATHSISAHACPPLA